jgi:hypothetical protein
MTEHIINEQRIDVPDDMTVVLETGFAGAFDHIRYRGVEICTYEQDDDQAYTSGFAVCINGDPEHVNELAEARTMIDAYHAEMLLAFTCKDCAVNTSAIGEYYMVTDDLWAKAGMAPDGGMLCIGCLETRIGRQLIAKDFPDYPVNAIGFSSKSERLMSRITCAEVLEAA